MGYGKRINKVEDVANVGDKLSFSIFFDAGKIVGAESTATKQQKEPLGLGHAVWTARSMVDGESCAVLLADDVILGGPEPCLKQLIDAHHKTGATVLAVRRFPRSEIGRYGVVATDGGKGPLYEVTDMVEKPKIKPPSHYANAATEHLALRSPLGTGAC